MLNKINFALVVHVDGANPNGDPLSGNYPRIRSNGHGILTAESIKRKIRNTFQAEGHTILLQAEGREMDEHRSLKSRLYADEAFLEFKELYTKKDIQADNVLQNKFLPKYIDIRLFGQTFTIQKKMSKGITGAVTIEYGYSIDVLNVEEIKITKSFNNEDSVSKGPDRVGVRYIINDAVFIIFGGFCPIQGVRNHVTAADLEALKQALLKLFMYDASSARPQGSMNVLELIWWDHLKPTAVVSPLVLKRALSIRKEAAVSSIPNYEIEVKDIPNVEMTRYRF